MVNDMYNDKPSRFLRGEITSRWQQLTSAEIDECCLERSKFVNVLQSRYGYARHRAEQEIDLFFAELEDRLRMTA
jgi:hypothetical protein